MAVVPALDLRPASAEPIVTAQPSNIEAEQALLGALLYDNAAYERIIDKLQGRHFHEPFHARLFTAVETHIRKGQLAEPILMADEFKRDPAFEELGGLRYLADLVDRAPPAANAPTTPASSTTWRSAANSSASAARSAPRPRPATPTRPPATRSNWPNSSSTPWPKAARPRPASSVLPTPCAAPSRWRRRPTAVTAGWPGFPPA